MRGDQEKNSVEALKMAVRFLDVRVCAHAIIANGRYFAEAEDKPLRAHPRLGSRTRATAAAPQASRAARQLSEVAAF
jgi:hypothetical protein